MSVSYLTQSNYYSPAFNTAIFDGPIRLYFARSQEAIALRIYFQLQEKLRHFYCNGKDLYRHLNQHIFIMLYPSEEVFDLSFPQMEGKSVCRVCLGADFVVGIRGVLPDEGLALVYKEVADIIKGWQAEVLPSPELTL